MTIKQTIEYSEMTDGIRAIRTVLKTGTGAFGTVRALVHTTAGYECAGSAARYTGERYGSLYETRTGTSGGKWFLTLDDAKADFERWTTPITEIAA